MSVFRIIAVVLMASLLASLTDWLFMDALVRRQYLRCPEIWQSGESRGRIALSQAIGTLASAAAVAMCLWVPDRPFSMTVAAWCAGALPLTLQQIQWMRVHPAIAVSHAMGWLSRLWIATLSAYLCLRG